MWINPQQNYQNLMRFTSASGYGNASFYAPQRTPYGPWQVPQANPYESLKMFAMSRIPRDHFAFGVPVAQWGNQMPQQGPQMPLNMLLRG